MIMHQFSKLLMALLIALSMAASNGCNERDQSDAPGAGIEFTDLGINLYGKFRFESEGERFDIIDRDSRILIPAGAVLTCIRRTYTIGYFAGGARVKEGAKSRGIPKVFFVLSPSGEVSYHAPSPDGNFPGEQLPDSIEFGVLYDSQNNQDEQAVGGDSVKTADGLHGAPQRRTLEQQIRCQAAVFKRPFRPGN